MRRRPFSALALFLLAALSSNMTLGEDLRQPSFGEPLYYAYQDKWFEALERLNAELRERLAIEAPNREAIWYQAVDENFSVADFELNYRMDRRAARILLAAIEETSDEPFHVTAAYRLARLHFRKGEPQAALRALDRIGGELPRAIRDDVAFLRASIYLALEWSEPAIPILQKLLKSKEYGAFAAYNLGIAYLQGDLLNAAHDQLDRAGKIKAKTAADAAIRDKANLVLGTLLYEEEQYNRAIGYLNRVRLDGPFSNRALLGAGWANMSSGRVNRAIVSWSTLAERDATDRATQEAMLALPYAYGELGVYSQAAVHYGRALDAYGRQIRQLQQSIESIERGQFLRALSREERRGEEDWVIRLRSLPDTPETYYLMELLASKDFQSGLENYLDLADLKRRLFTWSADLVAYDELVDARKQHFEAVLPDIDAQLRELESRLQQGFRQQAELLEQRKTMAMAANPQAEHHARLAEFDRNLRSLDEALTLAQRRYDRFRVSRHAATASFSGYDDILDSLSNSTLESTARIETLMARQGALLEKLATDELTRRLRRLEVYASKARFGLADSKDRVTRDGEQ